MHEIKFRTWNGKSMDYNPVFVADGAMLLDINHCFEHERYGEQWMHYTGRKDMNDVEVWEGDIVAMDLLEGRTFFKVIYSEDYARFCFRDIDNEDWFIGTNNSYFVVGNIYENPELLEVQP